MFEKLKADYLQSLVLKNYSPLSVRQMGQSLRIFLFWAKAHGIETPADVETATFENYKAYLSTGYVSRKGGQLAVGTIITRLFNVQNWFDWMKRKGVIYANPTAAVQLPKTVKRLPHGVLRPDEIRLVMAQPNIRTLLGYRDRTMMEVLYATGLRAAELMALKVADMDLKRKVLRVRHGKGGKDRFAPLSTPCCRFLDRYLSEIRPELLKDLRPYGNNWAAKTGTGGDFVFVSIYGGPFSSTWLGEIMRRYLLKAGITRPVSPVHGFRHSVATHLLENGMDVRYVQVLLGHENINSTQIYTHVERATLQRRLKECHPRELMRNQVKPYVEERIKTDAVAA